ncbi:sensor histidine kinase [Duganella qianjiadongensis]|uniref:Sensor histidine kinase n=1 Tax=Duganella qianjiadongensis TaxID=2692176 RepID=A0ABW9VIQ7_9BURK|nr:histidine kinase [Duganella qianjiadongensis]MYM39333.1 sensor histidine kinase [Duganella qianjiadongensis]
MPKTRTIVSIAWILFWGLMIATSVQEYLRDHQHGIWKPVLWETSSALVASVLLLLQRHYTRRHDALVAAPLRWFLRQLVWLPAYWILFVPLAFSLRHAVYGLMGEQYTHDGWTQVYLYEDIKMTIFFSLFTAITFGILSFHAMLDERLRVERANASLRQAQLLQLSQQMQPHFLFNALNTISSLMHSDVARADSMLVQLADVLRATLEVGERHLVTLETELRIVRGYAALMSERFADRVSITWDIEEGALTCEVPVMCLQPLLENVFKHTVERRRQPVAIRIMAQRQQTTLTLCVQDDSGLLPTPAIGSDTDAGSGISLRNLQERLAALYGKRASFELRQLAPAGVLAELRLPCAS